MTCTHCRRAIFWSFATDRYRHTATQGQFCRATSPLQARPLVRAR